MRNDQPGRLSRDLLPLWADIDLHAWLSATTGLPCRIDNDANVGALAEHWWGAGQGVSNFAYIKVATGVGAGVIIGGDIYRGLAALPVNRTRTIDPSGRALQLQGCLEAFVGTSTSSSARRGHCWPRRRSGRHLVPAACTRRGRRGRDAIAAELINDTGHWLGIAVSNLSIS